MTTKSDTPRVDELEKTFHAYMDVYHCQRLAIDLARTLETELAAERLKRQQAEHEKDCILEDLVKAVELLRMISAGMDDGTDSKPLVRATEVQAIRTFLAGDPAALL